jgi:hypothetical protein
MTEFLSSHIPILIAINIMAIFMIIKLKKFGREAGLE